MPSGVTPLTLTACLRGAQLPSVSRGETEAKCFESHELAQGRPADSVTHVDVLGQAKSTRSLLWIEGCVPVSGQENRVSVPDFSLGLACYAI